MPGRSIREVTFAFLDTETTGLSARHGGRICEIAILSVRDGRRVDLFQSLVDPQRSIEPGARAVHGITDGMVAGSPTFAQLSRRVHALLQDKVMVCHNAPFDKSFLRFEFKRAGLSMPDVDVLDTLTLARRHFKFGRNGLGHIADALGIKPEGWHRAGSDVAILDKVFRHFLEEFAKRGARTLEDLLKLQRGVQQVPGT